MDNVRRVIALLVLVAPCGTAHSQATKNCTVAECAQRAVEAATTAQSMVQNAVPKGAVMAFNLPNCPVGWQDLKQASGRVIVGSGQGNRDLSDHLLSPRNVGDIGGEEKHYLIVQEMPSHSHGVTAEQRWGDHQRDGFGWGHDDGGAGVATIQTGANGGDQPHNIMQPFLVLKYCERE